MKDSKLQFDRKNHVLYSKHGSFSQKKPPFLAVLVLFRHNKICAFFDLKKSDVA